jgi:hypothetical protein
MTFVEAGLVLIVAFFALYLSWSQVSKGRWYFRQLLAKMPSPSTTSTEREEATETKTSTTTDSSNEERKLTITERSENHAWSMNDLSITLQNVEAKSSVIGLLYLVAGMSFIIVYVMFAWK